METCITRQTGNVNTNDRNGSQIHVAQRNIFRSTNSWFLLRCIDVAKDPSTAEDAMVVILFPDVYVYSSMNEGTPC